MRAHEKTKKQGRLEPVKQVQIYIPSDSVNMLPLQKCYLIIYNALLVFGWLGVLILLNLEITGAGRHEKVYTKVEMLLKISQTAAILEVVHCAIGLVPSSVLLTFFQVWSRIFVLWFVTHLIPQVQDHIGVTMFLVCWSITEVIRYLYYVANILGSVPFPLQWCRYTFFIFLYPLGVSGELLTIYAALPFVLKSGVLSFQMPNITNFAFSYYHFLVLSMLLYIPIFPQLYLHMFSQRRKLLAKVKEN